MDALSAADLFAGAGGLALGVERAGYRTRLVVEHDPTAVDTLNRNRGKYFQSLDIVSPRDITASEPEEILRRSGIRRGDLGLLVGGPPCVAFSKSGFHLEYKRRGDDPNAKLLDQYLRYLDAARPHTYLMENVQGLSYRNQSAPFFDALVSGIRALGYSVQHQVLNAADYGVPQNRQRLFVIGARDGTPLRFPSPTHWGDLERRRRPEIAGALKPHITAGDALKGLRSKPEPEESVDGKYGHLLPEIPAGRNYLHFTAHEGHPNPQFIWRSRYWTFLLKLDPNRPSSTIQAQPGPYVGPFHWDNRRLRVPELKRLYGFPAQYMFSGTRREIQRQIGNAVPPKLAFVVADAIRKQVIGESMDSLDQGAQPMLPL